MRYSFFLMPLLTSFLLSSLLLVALTFFGRKNFFADSRNSQRHTHIKGISRFGGVAIILGFVASLFLDHRLFLSFELKGVLLCCMAILIYGAVDDIRQLGWKMQIFFQLAIIVLLYIFGVKLQYVTNPMGGIFFFDSGWLFFLGTILSVVWVMFLMNVMNWIDGVDGSVGGVALIATATIFLISLRPEVNQPPIGIITAALVGALAAFLILNFYPAKIMAGTSGSMFIGFVLAVLAIFAGAKIATTLMVLAVPIVDGFWVIGERLYLGKSIFVADKRHLHFRLMKLGWSVKKICFFYYVLTATIAVLALNMRVMGKIMTFSIIFIMMIGMLYVIRKKVRIMENV